MSAAPRRAVRRRKSHRREARRWTNARCCATSFLCLFSFLRSLRPYTSRRFINSHCNLLIAKFLIVIHERSWLLKIHARFREVAIATNFLFISMKMTRERHRVIAPSIEDDEKGLFFCRKITMRVATQFSVRLCEHPSTFRSIRLVLLWSVNNIFNHGACMNVHTSRNRVSQPRDCHGFSLSERRLMDRC